MAGDDNKDDFAKMMENMVVDLGGFDAPARDYLQEGYAYLKALSGGKFQAEEKQNDDGATTFETNLSLKNERSFIARRLRQLIDAEGNVFSNATADGAVPDDGYVPSLADHEAATRHADKEAADYQKRTGHGIMPAEEIQRFHTQAYDDYLGAAKTRDGYAPAEQIATPANPEDALREAGRLAALQGMVTEAPMANSGLGGAQQAVLHGITDGLSQRKSELAFIASLGVAPVVNSLEYLIALSGGALSLNTYPAAGRSELIVHLSGSEFDFFIKADKDGALQIGQIKGKYENYTFDAADDTHVNFILATAAKTAFFAGQITAIPALSEGMSAAERAMARTLQQAETQQLLVKEIFAGRLINGVEYLERAARGRLQVAYSQSHGNGDLLIEISGKHFSRSIRIDQAGVATMTGYTVENGQQGRKRGIAMSEETAGEFLSLLAQQAVSAGKIPGSFSLPAPEDGNAEQAAIYEAVSALERTRAREARLKSDMRAADNGMLAANPGTSLKHILAKAREDRAAKNKRDGKPNTPPPSPKR